MLLMTSVKTIGDFIPYASDDTGRKNIIIDAESERNVIASVTINEPDLKSCNLLKCEDPPSLD